MAYPQSRRYSPSWANRDLFWKPVVKTRGNPLPDRLKFLWRDNPLMGPGDGITVEREPGGMDLPYLAGLRDGGVEGVQELMDAIVRHGHVRVYTE